VEWIHRVGGRARQCPAVHELPETGLLLITDIHGDHLDTATLRGLDLAKVRMVAPQAVVDLLPADLQALTTPLANGAHIELLGIGIETIPMYNMPNPNDPRHPKAVVMGMCSPSVRSASTSLVIPGTFPKCAPSPT